MYGLTLSIEAKILIVALLVLNIIAFFIAKRNLDAGRVINIALIQNEKNMNFILESLKCGAFKLFNGRMILCDKAVEILGIRDENIGFDKNIGTFLEITELQKGYLSEKYYDKFVNLMEQMEKEEIKNMEFEGKWGKNGILENEITLKIVMQYQKEFGYEYVFGVLQEIKK